jgi:hypothetical protein
MNADMIKAAAVVLALAGCSSSEAPHVVSILPTGADTTLSWTEPLLWVGQLPGGEEKAWLGEGMLLSGKGESPYLPYRTSDGDSIRVAYSRWGAWLSGRVVSLDLEQDSAAAWLESAATADLAGLRLVSVPESFPPSLQQGLKRLAAANPQVGLWLASVDQVRTLLPQFHPSSLWLPLSVLLVFDSLAGQPQIEELTVIGPEFHNDSLSSVNQWVPELRGLPSLRRLRVIRVAISDAKFLPANLEMLELWGSLLDSKVLASLTRLRTLSFTWSVWSGGSDLAALRKLRWFGVPANATQAEFASVIHAHPDLEVIRVEGDSVTDLSPLSGMRHLQALVIGDETPPNTLDVLRGLPSLRFVGISWPDSTGQAAQLRAALPGTVVVKLTPFCLGSGWILLLIPVVALFLLSGPRGRCA